MSEVRECGNCGAVPSRSDSRFCEFCGTELPELQGDDPIRVEVVGPLGDLKARFERLEAHSSYERLMQLTPGTAGPAVGLYSGVIGAGCFTAVSFAIMLAVAGFAGPLAFIPGGFIAIGLVLMVMQLKKAAAYSAAALLREPSVILDERTRVSGGGNDSSASTSYFATLQFPDGSRNEYAVDGRTSGRVTKGDIGIAYLKSDVLVDFQRVDV
jgi:hypothetical protein